MRRAWILWLVGLVAFAGLAYGAAGWAMAGSFAAAAPERRDHRQAVIAYLATGAVSAASLVAVGIALARRARQPSDPDWPAV